MLDPAIAQRAELYLTGEMRHHDAVKAAAAAKSAAAMETTAATAVTLRLCRRCRQSQNRGQTCHCDDLHARLHQGTRQNGTPYLNLI